MRYLILSIPVWVLTGCNSTNQVGNVNPAFFGYRLDQLLVAVEGASAENVELELVSELTSAGIRAGSLRKTIEWAKNDEEARHIVAATGVNAILLVSVGNNTDVYTAMYQSNTSGQISTYGNYSQHTTMTPIRTISRDMSSAAELRDCRNTPEAENLNDCDIVWKGATQRHAQGLLFTGTGQMVSHTVNALIKALRQDGMLD